MNGPSLRPASVFGGGRSVLDGLTPEIVGFKAFNLMRMDGAGLPVPPGFVLHTPLCRDYLERGALTEALRELVRQQMQALEELTGLRFGDRRRPLLVSVRSGAAVSMAGMMDTLLNIGLTEETLPGLIRRTGNPHLAWDSYRRLVAAYTEVVRGQRVDFDELVRARIAADGCRTAGELGTRALRDIAQASLALARDLSFGVFPQDAEAQLFGAIEAVFRSWNGDRAVAYRALHGIPDEAGTGVIVQAMVFGNAGSTSGSGVGFTRDPSTGADELYFDFAFEAQGEDVVAGRHAPTDPERLVRSMPDLYTELVRLRRHLESEFGDMQDFEFTVEDGRLSMLQTRSGKRTPVAAVRIALDMQRAGLIDAATALARIGEVDLDRLTEDQLDTGGAEPLALAIPASSGMVTGTIALDSETAGRRGRRPAGSRSSSARRPPRTTFEGWRPQPVS